MSQRRAASSMQSRRLVLVALMFAVVYVGFASTAEAQNNLPPCRGSYPTSTWVYCQGAYTFPDGSKYVGVWNGGTMSGQGTYTWPNGAKHVGEWKEGFRNGLGEYFLPNGKLAKQGYWITDEYAGPTPPTLEEQTRVRQRQQEIVAERTAAKERAAAKEWEARRLAAICLAKRECAAFALTQKECATAGDINKCVQLKMAPRPTPSYCSTDGSGKYLYSDNKDPDELICKAILGTKNITSTVEDISSALQKLQDWWVEGSK